MSIILSIGKFERSLLGLVPVLLEGILVRMTTIAAAAQLETTLFVRASAAQVWDTITNGQQTARYYYDSPVESTWEPGAEVKYYSADRSSVFITGHVVTREPEKHLTLRLRLLFDPRAATEPPFEQTWTIDDLGAMCKVQVTHHDLPPTSATYRHIADGMPLILSSLKSLVETGQGLPMG